MFSVLQEMYRIKKTWGGCCKLANYCIFYRSQSRDCFVSVYESFQVVNNSLLCSSFVDLTAIPTMA